MSPNRAITGLSLLVVAAMALSCSSLSAATYEVGPGQALAAIGDVPWETLAPGDLVAIHYRAEAYREKWVICRAGTREAPIVIRGIAGPNGELPIVDGQNATTRLPLDYWGESRGVVKIGGANRPPDTTPKYILIENLDIRGARPPATYTDDSGVLQSYSANAAAIYIEKGEQITIRHCNLHGCGNGLVVSSSDLLASRDILVEGNYIYGNGNVGSIYEHNVYTAALGIVFQFNRFGPLLSGASGNNLKDRSAGLVVRCNWIEGGNRQLDLVDASDSVLLRQDAQYRATYVFGNLLIEPEGDGNTQILQYGGDSGTVANYRKGTLWFYNNTVVSKRTDKTVLFSLSTNEEACTAFNNVMYVTAAGNTLGMLNNAGLLTLSHNWLKPGWVKGFSSVSGTISDDGTSIGGTTPGFLDEAGADYRLGPQSGCLDAGTSGPIPPAMALNVQYLKHQGSEARPTSGAVDVGAFEFSRLESWRQSRFGANAPAIEANEADSDCDGLSNLVEYALGSDPLTPSPVPLPCLVEQQGGSRTLGLRFTRLTPPAEITYRVETSPDLVHWDEGSRYSDSGDIPAKANSLEFSRTGSGPWEITVVCSGTVGSGTRGFMRLKVTQP